MVKLDLITGFLGAGKTTLINKLLRESCGGERPVVIENEFGEVPIDKELIDVPDIQVRLLASGCICCSLKGDFIRGIAEVVEKYAPERIIIEPTGLADISDMVEVCIEAAGLVPVEINSVITVANAENFIPLVSAAGSIFRRQAEEACFILLSRSRTQSAEQLAGIHRLIGTVNPGCRVMDGDWDELDAMEITAVAEQAWAERKNVPAPDAARPERAHAADGFMSVPCFPRRSYTEAELDAVLDALAGGRCGEVFRAKGFLRTAGGGFEQVEYVYGRASRRPVTRRGLNKFIVIGRGLDAAAIERVMESGGKE